MTLRGRLTAAEKQVAAVPTVHEDQGSEVQLILSDPQARGIACDLAAAIGGEVPDPVAEAALTQALGARLAFLSAHVGDRQNEV